MTLFADRVTNVPVPFQRLRMKDAEGVLQEGVYGANDLKAAQRAAGANMSVDVAVGAAWVTIGTGTRNGLAHVYNDAVANLAVTAAHATLPRIDRVILRYNSTAIPTGSGDTPTLEVLAGTPTTGAQASTPTAANYLTGAQAVPADAMLIADIGVAAAAASITTAAIIDRRPWARGLHRYLPGATSGPTTNLGYASATQLTEMGLNAEFSGAPVEVAFSSDFTQSVANNFVGTELRLDGSPVSTADAGDTIRSKNLASTTADGLSWVIEFTPSAGRHALAVYWWVGANLGTAVGTRRQMRVREILAQNANNT